LQFSVSGLQFSVSGLQFSVVVLLQFLLASWSANWKEHITHLGLEPGPSTMINIYTRIL
jgi:hypothetical protein